MKAKWRNRRKMKAIDAPRCTIAEAPVIVLDCESIVARLKANYGARAGQVIQGNLGRGGDGKFVRAGAGGGGASPSRVDQFRGGGSGRPSTRKPARGKKPDATQSTQESIAGAAGLNAGDLRALQSFDAGGQMDSATAARLATAGLVDIGRDGAPRLAPNVSGALSALRKGDARAAADALGRARDRKGSQNDTAARIASNAQKRADAASARAQRASQRRTEVQQRRDAAQRKRDEARGATQAQRTARTEAAAKVQAQTIGNRVEVVATRANEITAAGDWDKKQVERKRLGNQLEQEATRVQSLAIPDADKAKLTAQISAAMTSMDWGSGDGETFVPATTKQFTGGSTWVLKDSSGAYRWVTYSSNVFEDREREIVSGDALMGAVHRMDTRKQYGPARWWHVGEVLFKDLTDWESVYAGDGLDVGECDFSEQHNGILVESGTFKDAIVGEAFAEIAARDGLEVSIGFTHPANQPIDGVYKDIAIFERSFLPVGRAANSRTGVSVITNKEQKMNQISGFKKTALKTLLGNRSDAVFAILDGADGVQKEALAAGARFKEDGSLEPAIAANVAGDSEEGKAAGDAPPTDPNADPNADPANDPNAPTGDFLGDMSIEDFKALQTELNTPLVQAITSLAEMMGSASKSADAATTKAYDGVKAALNEFQKRLKSLEGDAPSNSVYRASEDNGTKVEPPPSTTKAKDPSRENELTQLADFWVNGTNGAAS